MQAIIYDFTIYDLRFWRQVIQYNEFKLMQSNES